MLSLLSKWPLIRQLQTGTDGTGAEAMSERTLNLAPRNANTEVARGVCPYCAVGCGLLVHHRDGKLVNIEGDPASPVSRGHLCPKGANTEELHTHPARLTKVRYRAPRSTRWREMDLETAMDMVAERVWQSRERSFLERKEHDGQYDLVMNTTAIGHLGGATLDNEENYLIKKLFSGGLGMVCVSNQARI